MRQTSDTPLERLLIDASLGEAGPDWSWLLEEYLTEHPEHREQAEAIRATLGLAKETLAAVRPARVALPPMPDFERAGRSRFLTPRLLWPALATICLLLGWTLGSIQSPGSFRPQGAGTPGLQSTALTATPVRLTTGEAEHPSGGFWSQGRWVQRFQRNRRREDASRMIEWQAPFVPKIEERTERET